MMRQEIQDLDGISFEIFEKGIYILGKMCPYPSGLASNIYMGVPEENRKSVEEKFKSKDFANGREIIFA